jgi:hypothetical protein
MGPTSLLNFIIKATKQGDAAAKTTDEIKKLGKASKDTGDIAGKFNKKMLAVQATVLAMGIALVKGVPALMNQGIAIKRANVALEAYTGSTEAAEEALEGVIRATDGAIDKFTATQNATKLFSMGLASNAAEAEKLTKIAVTLGAAMGKDAKGAFEEFTLLLANQSIQRLDTFGISAGQVRTRINELTAANKDLDRQTAFMIATMEIGEQRLGELDAAGFEASNSVDILTARLTDMKDEAATLVADGLVPLIDDLLLIIDTHEDTEEAIKKTAVGYAAYSKRIEEARKEAGWLYLFIPKMTEEQYNLERATQRAELSFEALTEAEYWQLNMLEETTTATETLTDRVPLLSGALDSLTGDMDASKAMATLLKDGIKAVSDSMVDQERLTLVLKLAREDLTAAEIEELLVQQDQLEMLAELNQAYADDIISRGTWISVVADGIITEEELNAALGRTSDELSQIEIDAMNAAAGLETLETKAKNAAGTYTMKFIVNVEGNIPRVENYGGGTEFQHGGDFIVPPGFPNDTYPISVTSGERVVVMTQAQQRQAATVSAGAQVIKIFLDGEELARSHAVGMRDQGFSGPM